MITSMGSPCKMSHQRTSWVELARKPCWSRYSCSAANLRGLWLRCRSDSICSQHSKCSVL